MDLNHCQCERRLCSNNAPPRTGRLAITCITNFICQAMCYSPRRGGWVDSVLLGNEAWGVNEHLGAIGQPDGPVWQTSTRSLVFQERDRTSPPYASPQRSVAEELAGCEIGIMWIREESNVHFRGPTHRSEAHQANDMPARWDLCYHCIRLHVRPQQPNGRCPITKRPNSHPKFNPTRQRRI
jgi:hypothetical protein